MTELLGSDAQKGLDMWDRLLIALHLKKPPTPRPALVQPDIAWPRAQNVPKPAPRPTARNGWTPPRAMPPAPAPAYAVPQSTSSTSDSGDTMLHILMAQQTLANSNSLAAHECRREPEPERFSSGGAGDFGGGGASGDWDAPSPTPAPAYEPPAPSPSYDSGSSYSSSSSDYGSSSSDSSSSSSYSSD